ncbi:MAG: MBL fold metallo-hydrolase [Gammaproteobacteria bacterium]|nr:MBL fold metallo-hydrolase [Gammaproteobacteria bacterium]
MSFNKILTTGPLLLTTLLASSVSMSTELKTVAVTDDIYMLMGKGGNIGLSTGNSGTLIIDDQYAPATTDILSTIAEQTKDKIQFVVNTHWHGDHTGGNENLGKMGAVIVAHENVRETMSKDQFIEVFNMSAPASPKAALPVITFVDGITFHWNNDTIQVQHVATAHTNGDAIVHFKNANVVHAGDTFFNKMYPFIDVTHGGSIDGMIAATEKLLGMADEQTKIIPGHGPLANKTDLRAYRDMLVAVRSSIHDLKRTGKTRADVIAAKPTAAYDDKWGKGFLKPDVWVGIVYDSL